MVANSAATSETDKHPQLRRLKTELQAERQAILAKAAPLRAKRDALAQQMRPLEQQMRELDHQIEAIERPRLVEVDNQISALARAMGAKRMLWLIAWLSLCATVQAQLPPITYVAGPHGDTSSTSANGGPFKHPIGMDLMAQVDGVRTVLVEGTTTGSLLSASEPCPSFDGESIYYTLYSTANGKRMADIYAFDRATGQSVPLTNAATEFTPPQGTAAWGAIPVGRGVHNTAACYMADGIVFTSTRRGLRSLKENWEAFQLFRMDADGKNVECIGFLNLGGAMHPTIRRDGTVAFSSGEMQGLRGGGGNYWGVWTIYPDGGQWGPLFSALGPHSPLHFQCETSAGYTFVIHYYDTQLNGPPLGFPPFVGGPFSPPTMFGPHDPDDNPSIRNGWNSSGTNPINSGKWSFQPRGLFNLFPDMTSQDWTPKVIDGVSAGTASHPFPLPNGALGFTWRRGTKKAQNDSTIGEIGLYYVDDPTHEHEISDIKLLVDEPGVMECFGRYLGPITDIYGSDPPSKRYPRTEPPVIVDGEPPPVDRSLPEGSPFAVVGTASLSWRETEALSGGGMREQGGDKSVANDEIEYVAIVSTKATELFEGALRLPVMRDADGGNPSNRNGFGNQFNERISWYEPLIPITKHNAEGDVILGPDGQRDTSFSCEIPAGQPWTLAYFDANKDLLGLAQTWHQAMPGEQRTDCGGCHAHHQPAPFAFETTAAASDAYERLRLTHSQPVTEYWTDVRSIFEAHGVVDAAGAIHTRASLFAAGHKDFLAARSPLITAMRGGAYPGMTDAEISTVSTWIATGMTEAGLEVAGGPRLTPETMRGPWADTNPPTLVVVPERRPTEPVSQIVIGACDPDGGLNVSSLSVSCDFDVAGRDAGSELADLFVRDEAQSLWTLALDAPITSGEITASIRDNQQAKKVDGTPLGEAGNLTRIGRSFTVVGSEPPPDHSEEIAALEARIVEIDQELAVQTAIIASAEAERARLLAERAAVEQRIAELESQ